MRGMKDKEEVQAAKQVLKEARNSRAVSGCRRLHFVFCMRRVAHLDTLSVAAVSFTLRTGPRTVRGRPGAAETGLPVWRAGQSCRQGAAGTSVVTPLCCSQFLTGLRPHRLTRFCGLQVIVDSMVALCRELCPLSAAAAERLSPPLSSISERVSIPRSAIRTALMERAAQDVHRALE